ncbi:MAG: SocA family protein [Candidatus Aminicenantes bacterium]|nr:SocA family protein [Candidatus Aminicenantes bacterium]
MNGKTKQFLIYIAKNYIPATVTSLMKLAYLADLVSVTKEENQISNFKYKRYKYGPFDSKIYGYLTELANQEILKEEIEYTATAEEYIKYKFNENKEDIKFDKLDEKEMNTTDEVLESLKGYGVKALTEITYKTKPMLALGATLGGEENLNVPLDLKAK